MKKMLIVLFISAAVGYSIFTFLHIDYTTDKTEFVFSTGKEPGPDPRPDEWAYIKKNLSVLQR